MSLIKSEILRNKFSVICFPLRLLSSATKKLKEYDVKKSVFISQSNDVFTNLALEDWLYRNFDFSNHHVLMLWRNNPCVVIGRHQNPWIEANVNSLPTIAINGVQLARRNSGGGTVYHDMGNLNMTFFTSREHYSRKQNLELIKRALFREYNIDTILSSREDLTIRNLKISGTASKLGRVNSYHHCTLLVDVNKTHLQQALQNKNNDIVTNATKSIKSKITNLIEEDPKLTVEGLSAAIGWEFMRTTPVFMKLENIEKSNKSKGFHMINPTEKWFPGLQQLRSDLENWNWCYGKTPKFSISRSFPIPAQFTNSNIREELNVTVIVEQGIISEVILDSPPNFSASGYDDIIEVITNLKGCQFTGSTINSLEVALENVDSNDKYRFVGECVKQLIRCN